MKFSAILPLAFALLAVGQEVAESLEARNPQDTYMTKEDLDREEGLTLDPGFGGPLVKPVSTQCVARPRGSTKRRSLDMDMEIEGAALELFDARDSSQCPVTGHLTHPGKRTFIHGIKYQRCANTCVCRGDFNGCKAFAWKPNNKGKGRGLCVLYHKTLDQMGFTTSPSVPGGYPTRSFYARSCFHKAKPSQTGQQTTLAPRATPVARKRDIELQDHLIAAMGQV